MIGAPEPCNYCRGQILWLRTAKGALMPVDAAPDPQRGNVLRHGDTAAVIGKPSQAAALRAAGPQLRTHHRLTCPQARLWARGGAR